MQPRRPGINLALAVLVLLAAGCTLPPFYPSVPAEVSAEPNYICSGDPVDVVWNLNLPSHQDFCEYPTGGYSEARACTDGSDCPVGGRCSDGLCCASPIPLAECGSSCPPDATSTVAFAPAGPDQTNPYGSGRISFSPTRTTAITLTGEWGPPTTAKGPVTARIVVVDEPPLENLVMGFPFACSSTGGGSWFGFVLARADVRPSPLVVVASVQNTSGRQITLSDGVHPREILDAGASTTAFNGRLAGTIWLAALTSLGTLGLPIPRCGPLERGDPYPDLSVEVTLACESDLP